MIQIEIAGTLYRGFTSADVMRTVEAVSGKFNFSATVSDASVFPIKRSQPCRVLIGGTAVVTGYVEEIDISYGVEEGVVTHEINIRGRDRTADIIDSSVVGEKTFISPISLVQVIRRTLTDNGITNIKVIDQVGTIVPFAKDEQVGIETGETVFDFIESYCRMRQVLPTTDGQGNLILTRAGAAQALTKLVHVRGNRDNNIKRASVSYSEVERFNLYRVRTQMNPSSGGVDAVEEVASQTGVATDAQIRASRKLEIVAETPGDNTTAADRAVWERNFRRARASLYQPVVQGFYQDAAQTTLWQPNQLVEVEDDYADIRATMLVKEVQYSYSLDSGSETTLTCVDKDVYTLQAEANQREERAERRGDEYQA